VQGVLLSTAEEARRLNHHHIGVEHLLLGLLAEEGCFAAEILRGLGLSIEKVRQDLAGPPGET
jgi:ATP-dependent Clp protease ATP-binding subunit ClpC